MAMTLALALSMSLSLTAHAQEDALAPFSQIHLSDKDRAALKTAPRRIVSINMCTDELALRLARPGALVSVTPLAVENIGSNAADLAQRVPVNRGAAEEVASLSPDLVTAGRYTTRATVRLLRMLGVRVAEFDVPNTIAGVRDQISEAGALFHNPAAARALASRFDALLAQAPPQGPRPTAVVLRPAGFTSSEGSLLDDMLTRAGMRNLAGGELAGYEQLPLEYVLAARPDLLIIAGDPDAPPALANAFLSHPALRSLKGHTRIVVLPSRLWTCPGPGVLDAMQILTRAAADWRAARAAVSQGTPDARDPGGHDGGARRHAALAASSVQPVAVTAASPATGAGRGSAP